MNKQTKYYFLIKNTILCFIINLILGIVRRGLSGTNIFNTGVMNFIDDVLGVSKTLLVIAVIAGFLYLIYLVFAYYSSAFYRLYRISAFEGIYHGFIDIYQVHDKLSGAVNIKNLIVDFKHSTIYFESKEGNYCIKFLDLFGKIEGKLDSEFWASVSKPKTKYNQKVYTKKVRFRNPYRSNEEYIRQLKSKTNKIYKNYIVISGFYKISHKSDYILAPYELLDFVK